MLPVASVAADSNGTTRLSTRLTDKGARPWAYRRLQLATSIPANGGVGKVGQEVWLIHPPSVETSNPRNIAGRKTSIGILRE